MNPTSPPPRVSPQEAAQLLDSGEYAYLDVRTPEEFALGHARGAYNVPSHLEAGGGRLPNEDFVGVVQAAFTRGTKLVVGCQVGSRSVVAAQQLMAAGFEVVEMHAGYGGARDAFGRVTEKGWLALGLPTSSEPEPAHDYATLLARFRVVLR
ncbi:MAG TPA: rhodanese-like domain-containing protein [Polyangiales bacterium]|nr:rhodanese-like domain-containing protein [Polyangiales bacterium]